MDRTDERRRRPPQSQPQRRPGGTDRRQPGGYDRPPQRRSQTPRREDYRTSQPSFREVTPGHFVLCNDEEFARYQSEVE